MWFNFFFIVICAFLDMYNIIPFFGRMYNISLCELMFLRCRAVVSYLRYRYLGTIFYEHPDFKATSTVQTGSPAKDLWLFSLGLKHYKYWL